ncbi:SBBP repeat-containing protein [Shewanella psychropiezotolerans]|uniref:SBBP repeat-containing protein n=1 Tax=Shewanella psychropiezotolerans TaxID=2593655 RepID=UPI001E29CA9A|nr:SBBP repeat-containing protein [Shewanella psychropiezotolerans]
MSWMIVKNYLYNLVYVEGVNYIERINLVDYSKQTVKLDNNNIIGNSISVDEHGNVFLVASEQSNVDIVKIVFSKADL